MSATSVTSSPGRWWSHVLAALRRTERPELLFRLSIAGLACWSVILGLSPGIHGHAVAPAIDLALDTMAALVSLSVTALMWVRFRERRDPIATYQAAGFLALTIAYLTAVLVSLERDGNPVALSEPNTGQVFVFAVARLLTAGLVVVGGVASLGRGLPRRPLWILVLPAIVVLGVVALSYRTDVSASMPGLALVLADPGGSALPVVTPFGVLVQVISACLFFAAAAVLRWNSRRTGTIGDAYLAVGLLFAGFAEIQWAMFPVGHPGQISTADLLRLAFFVALLLAIEAEARVTLAKLRVANVELANLRRADVERASLEERARLARELHDGLAQDLWLAKLRAGQLAAVPNLPTEAGPLLAEACAAIDAGLAEARQAVMALRIAADATDGFAELMVRYIDDFQDRFGLRVEFRCSGDTSDVAPRIQAEILRIAQEALVNIRQHAAATVVGVSVEVADGRISLRVADNGRGFDVAAARGKSFGLHSMRERTQLIGGRLQIHSRPGDGTRIVMTAPIAQRRAGEAVAG